MSCLSTKQSWSEIWAVIPRFAHCRQVRTWRISQLATKARFKDRNGEQQERTEWHRVVAFGKLADNCQRLLSKGRQVYVEGRLTTRQYEAKDGSGTRYRTEIVALQMRLLGNRTNGTAAPKAKASDDIPF